MDKFKKRKWQFTLIYLLISIGMLYFIQHMVGAPRPREVSYSEFLDAVKADQLAEVNIKETELMGVLKDEAAKPHGGNKIVEATRLPGIDETDLLKELESHHVKFSGSIESRSWFTEMMIMFLPFLLLIGIYGFAMRRFGQGGAGPL